MASNTGGVAAPLNDAPGQREDWMHAVASQFGLRDREGKGAPPTLTPGDRAALRRMDTTRRQTAEGAVIKLLAAAGIPDYIQTRDFDRWQLIAHVAAMLSGTGKLRAHAPTRSIGAVLQESDYSENRLLRLVAARGEALHDQVRRAARIIRQKDKQPINLWTLYHLLSDDPAKSEEERIRIARDYYAAAARSEKGISSDD